MGLKSPSDGRWDGRCRTGFVTSPYTEEKKDALTRTFGIDHGLMGISPWQMDVDHDGQDATIDVGRLPGHMAALIGLFGTCDMMLEPQEGQRFTHLVVIMP
jgi:hypothetical protein